MLHLYTSDTRVVAGFRFISKNLKSVILGNFRVRPHIPLVLSREQVIHHYPTIVHFLKSESIVVTDLERSFIWFGALGAESFEEKYTLPTVPAPVKDEVTPPEDKLEEVAKANVGAVDVEIRAGADGTFGTADDEVSIHKASPKSEEVPEEPTEPVDPATEFADALAADSAPVNPVVDEAIEAAVEPTPEPPVEEPVKEPIVGTTAKDKAEAAKKAKAAKRAAAAKEARAAKKADAAGKQK